MTKPFGAMRGKLFFFGITLLVFLPILVGAQTGDDAAAPFRFLVGIPGVDGGITEGSFSAYVNALYAVAIGIAGLLAVIKLIVAGTKYMLSDIVTDKQSAKNDIKWSLVGLLVVLGAVVILTTINTDLTNVDVTLTQLDGDTTNYLAENLANIRSIEEYCNSLSNCEIQRCIRSCDEWCSNIPGSRFIPGSALGYTFGAANYRDVCIFDPDNNTQENQIAGELERIGNPDIGDFTTSSISMDNNTWLRLWEANILTQLGLERGEIDTERFIFESTTDGLVEEYNFDSSLYEIQFNLECQSAGGNTYALSGNPIRYYCISS